MSDNLRQIEDWAAALLANLTPAERRRANRRVAAELRRSQAQRIAIQRNPDGSPFAPRKQRKDLRGKRGRIKRAMFTRLRNTRNLKAKGTADEIAVGFFGRVARISRVHQWGLSDRPGPGAPDVRYPQRELLGFTQDDIELVRDALTRHLSSGL